MVREFPHWCEDPDCERFHVHQFAGDGNRRPCASSPSGSVVVWVDVVVALSAHYYKDDRIAQAGEITGLT